MNYVDKIRRKSEHNRAGREKTAVKVMGCTVSVIQLSGANSLTKRNKIVVQSHPFVIHKRTGYSSKYFFFNVQIGKTSEKSNYSIINQSTRKQNHDKIFRLVVPKEKKTWLLSTEDYEVYYKENTTQLFLLQTVKCEKGV